MIASAEFRLWFGRRLRAGFALLVAAYAAGASLRWAERSLRLKLGRHCAANPPPSVLPRHARHFRPSVSPTHALYFTL